MNKSKKIFTYSNHAHTSFQFPEVYMRFASSYGTEQYKVLRIICELIICGQYECTDSRTQEILELFFKLFVDSLPVLRDEDCYFMYSASILGIAQAFPTVDFDKLNYDICCYGLYLRDFESENPQLSALLEVVKDYMFLTALVNEIKKCSDSWTDKEDVNNDCDDGCDDDYGGGDGSYGTIVDISISKILLNHLQGYQQS